MKYLTRFLIRACFSHSFTSLIYVVHALKKHALYMQAVKVFEKGNLCKVMRFRKSNMQANYYMTDFYGNELNIEKTRL